MRNLGHILRAATLCVVASAGAVTAAPQATRVGEWVILPRAEVGCMVGTASKDKATQLMIAKDAQFIRLMVNLGQSVPEGDRTVGLKIDQGKTYWLGNSYAKGRELFVVLPNDETGTDILRALVDGGEFTIKSDLASTVAKFSLKGSGKAIVALSQCPVEQG